MIFIDTPAFIARYMANDQYHRQAMKIWESIKKKALKCFTSNFVLDEVFTFVGRRAGNNFVAERAENIYASESIMILRPDEKDELNAIGYFKKYSDQKVSFTDCVSFVLMKKHRITKAFTFDKHFRLPGFLILSDNIRK
jgi:predicted nucleic acid-binding protein